MTWHLTDTKYVMDSKYLMNYLMDSKELALKIWPKLAQIFSLKIMFKKPYLHHFMEV